MYQPTKACFYVSRTSHALILRGATRMSKGTTP